MQEFVLQLFWLLMAAFLVAVYVLVIIVFIAFIVAIWMVVKDAWHGSKSDS